MADVVFMGAKGGVGTTTVAILHALEEVAQGHTVRLTATASAALGDLAAVLGVAEPVQPGRRQGSGRRPSWASCPE